MTDREVLEGLHGLEAKLRRDMDQVPFGARRYNMGLIVIGVRRISDQLNAVRRPESPRDLALVELRKLYALARSVRADASRTNVTAGECEIWDRTVNAIRDLGKRANPEIEA